MFGPLHQNKTIVGPPTLFSLFLLVAAVPSRRAVGSYPCAQGILATSELSIDARTKSGHPTLYRSFDDSFDDSRFF